ncbi:CBF/Mak21 family-domain-containing protein, partial [Blyttiomyces helicus]
MVRIKDFTGGNDFTPSFSSIGDKSDKRTRRAAGSQLFAGWPGCGNKQQGRNLFDSGVGRRESRDPNTTGSESLCRDPLPFLQVNNSPMKRKNSDKRVAAPAKKPALSPASATPADARRLAKECLESATKLNNVVTLLEWCESTVPSLTHASLLALHYVFSELSKRGGLKKPAPAASGDNPEPDPKSAVSTWLRENRTLFVAVLVRVLQERSDAALQIASLETLLALLKQESEVMKEFQNALFQRVVEACVSSAVVTDQLIVALVKNLNAYDDLRMYFYKDLGKFLEAAREGTHASKRRKGAPDNSSVSIIAINAFKVLDKLANPKSEAELGQLHCVFEKPEKAGGKETVYAPLQVTAHRRAFESCWLALLRHQMTPEIYKRVLLVLHKRIIPFMNKPAMLIDFLIDSYELGRCLQAGLAGILSRLNGMLTIGGVISMLALNGLLTLILEHNLDYPYFFKKLYSLLDRNIMHVNSLPTYLVAAFIKRLARLSLTAPPSGIVIIIPFIYNLLKRHPACVVLIHRDGDDEVETT